MLLAGSVTVVACAASFNDSACNETDDCEAAFALAWSTTWISAATFAICVAARVLARRRPSLGFLLAALGWGTVALNPLTHEAFGISRALGLAVALAVVTAAPVEIVAAMAEGTRSCSRVRRSRLR